MDWKVYLIAILVGTPAVLCGCRWIASATDSVIADDLKKSKPKTIEQWAIKESMKKNE